MIFAGRAAHLITRGLPGGVHVRLIASPETRIMRVAGLLRCSHADAARHIERNDQARSRFVRTNFQREISDPHLYDLVLNTDRVPAESCVRLIARALHERLALAKTAITHRRDPIHA